jgi:glutamyl-tRNA reductase
MLYYNGISYKDVKLRNFGKSLMYFKKYLKGKKLKNYVALVTCNRVELYTDIPLKISGFKQKKDRKSILHLFKVAAGIDSLIVGENEIAVQVKQAYERAKKERHCYGGLALVFDRAIKTAKKIRSKTKINHGKTSLASISVETVIKKYKPKNVLVIGSGMLAAKIAKALSRKNVDEIILSNRHFKRAKDLAKKIKGKADKLDNLKKLLETANVVFSATSCPLPVVYNKDVPAGKRIIFVDLAVPNDVDNKVDKMREIETIRLDHFKKIINKNKKEKKKEIRKAEKIINSEVDRVV